MVCVRQELSKLTQLSRIIELILSIEINFKLEHVVKVLILVFWILFERNSGNESKVELIMLKEVTKVEVWKYTMLPGTTCGLS